ncbi:hypothetical protein ACOMCU_03850, partial [Lysinibacillus sp. UGB7]
MTQEAFFKAMKAIKNFDGSLIDYLIKSVVNIKKGIFIWGK